jgi:polyhydroxybutyrate depolymerase
MHPIAVSGRAGITPTPVAGILSTRRTEQQEWSHRMAFLPRPRAQVIPLLAAAAALVGSLALTGTAVAATTTTTTPAATLAPMSGSYAFSLTFDGMARSYRVHVPPAAASGAPLPMVLNLHGDTQNGQLEELQTQMDSNADTNGYLVVYPNGTRVSKVLTPDPVAKQAQYGWNAGVCCALPAMKKINDVGFLARVIADVATRTPVNLRRVYITGISSGGMMANAMAAQAADHIAAVASVEGPIEIPTIHPSRVVPALEFASKTDPIVPYNGTPNKNPKLVLSAQDGVNQWVKNDGCSTTPHVAPTIVGAGSISAGETATLVTYGHCKDGAQVELERFTGSGHVWPGSSLNTGPMSGWVLQGVGRGIVLVDGNQAMWDFFKQYELPK